MGAGRNGPRGSGGAVAWRPVRHSGQSAPGCGRMPAMGPALAFVRKNAAHENARERAWGSSPKRLLPDPPYAGEVQTVQNDVPANPCILRHPRTFALVLDKVQSNEGLPGAKSAARSSPRSRFEPAVRTPGWACRSPPAAQGSEASPAARNTLASARIPRASKLLICGLFQMGRVLAQDGITSSPISCSSSLRFTCGNASADRVTNSVLARVEPVLLICVLVRASRSRTSAAVPTLVRACAGRPRQSQAGTA